MKKTQPNKTNKAKTKEHNDTLIRLRRTTRNMRNKTRRNNTLIINIRLIRNKQRLD